VHFDGYNQLDRITGKGPSARHEIFYLTVTKLAAVRIDNFKYRFTDQPGGWPGTTEKVDWPILVNLRLDPYERTGMLKGKDNRRLLTPIGSPTSSGVSCSFSRKWPRLFPASAAPPVEIGRSGAVCLLIQTASCLTEAGSITQFTDTVETLTLRSFHDLNVDFRVKLYLVKPLN
jgi:hypothetical protein